MNPTLTSFGDSYEVKTFLLEEGKSLSFTPPVPVILFNTSPYGFSIFGGENEFKKLKKGEIVILFPGFPCSFLSEKKIDITILSVPDISLLYYRYISPFFIKKKRRKELLFSLKMNPFIISLVEQIHLYEEDNMLFSELPKIKTIELLILLKHSYKADKIFQFFYPVLTGEYQFIGQVLSFYQEVNTVNELANRCNCSLSTFNRKFQSSFNISPYKWMIKKKTEKVYQAIIESTDSLKQVADEIGFSSLSQMIDYCKKHIGMTPGEIRRQKEVHPEYELKE